MQMYPSPFYIIIIIYAIHRTMIQNIFYIIASAALLYGCYHLHDYRKQSKGKVITPNAVKQHTETNTKDIVKHSRFSFFSPQSKQNTNNFLQEVEQHNDVQ